jgi:hypothetical protein
MTFTKAGHGGQARVAVAHLIVSIAYSVSLYFNLYLFASRRNINQFSLHKNKSPSRPVRYAERGSLPSDNHFNEIGQIQ